MYGIGAYFALRNAVKAFNPSVNILYDAPLTPEKVLMSLYAKPPQKIDDNPKEIVPLNE